MGSTRACEPARLPRRDVLIGRQRELTQLWRALEDTQRGRGRIVLVGGEPGIGKTRLAHELASVAATRPVTILWGRCIEGPSPPYWPWAQIVGSFAERGGAEMLRDLLHPAAGPLCILVPPRRHRQVREEASGGHAERVRLFDAMRRFVQRASRPSPLLLVLEDLHWADRNSLLLLELVAQHAAPVRLMVLATYRDNQVSQALGRTFGELARLGAQRLGLGGLALHDTSRLIRAVSGRTVSDEMVRAVHARSSGNPFFVTEIARLPAASLHTVPENVRDAIARRFTLLSAPANRILSLASVIGREFDFRIVVSVLCAAGDESLLRGLDEALQAQIVEPLPRRGTDWYQFRHELIREALYESASPSRRSRLHAAIVRALERLQGPRVEDHAAQIALHAAHAEALVGSATVVKYSRMAGEQKLATFAFDEALPHFERAWHAREPAPLDAEAAAILYGLGCAQAATAVRWNRQDGWATLRRAIDYYVQTGQLDRAVAAAAHPTIVPEGASDVSNIIEPILAAIPSGSMEEGWLRARLGAAIYFETGDHARARTAFDRALLTAAGHGEPALELRTLAYETSVDHFALRWADVLAKSRRVLELAQRIDDLHSEAYARYRAAFVLTNTGRADEARLEIEANLDTAERLRDHGLLADALYVAATLAQLTGAWSEARAHSDRGLRLAPEHLPLLHGRVLLEYEMGHETQGAASLQRLLAADRRAGPYPLAGVFTAIALAQAAELSTRTASADAAGVAIRNVLARAPSIPNAVVTARIARALLCSRDPRAGDSEAELEFLEPFERVVPSEWCVATGRLLGRLAQAAGQPRRAAAWFDRALAFCRHSGYRPELAWTCYEFAGALLEHGSRDDRIKAAALVAEAEQIAGALEMRPLAGRIAAFRARYHLKLDRKPAGLTNRELEILRHVAAGKSNKEIAQMLFISVNTVAVHVTRVLAKTGASNRTEAAAHAARHHLL